MKRLSSFLLIAVPAIAFLLALSWTGVGHVLADAVKITLTQDVDNPGRHPFQTVLSVSVPSACTSSCIVVSTISVPAGERLVIDQVSVRAFVPPGVKPIAYVESIGGGGSANAGIPLVLQGGGFGGVSGDQLVGTLPGPLYVDAGANMAGFTGQLPDGTGPGSFLFNVAGHLITCPC